MEGRLVLLSGERGAGKTTVCRETIELARSHGYTCGGLLTLPRGDGVLDVLDVRSGDSQQLTVDPADPEAVPQGAFHFGLQTLSWGNGVLATAAPCDLLVIDELGPLEIVQGRGWWKAFDGLRRSDFALALAVIRPKLLTRAHLKLPLVSTTVLTATTENRQELPEAIVALLRREVDALSRS
ncbi:MAG: hypothetical protein E3J64_03215 [Anaerolineales bacterium]|nr:MAG: hypothetical protein E3J64_03215 [Anaerolineales bacterium]